MIAALAGVATVRVVQLARWDRRAAAGGEEREQRHQPAVDVLAPPAAVERAEVVEEPPGIRATR